MAETVLVVEDEADILQVLQYNLEASGYHVVTATAGTSSWCPIATLRLWTRRCPPGSLGEAMGIDATRPFGKPFPEVPVHPGLEKVPDLLALAREGPS